MPAGPEMDKLVATEIMADISGGFRGGASLPCHRKSLRRAHVFGVEHAVSPVSAKISPAGSGVPDLGSNKIVSGSSARLRLAWHCSCTLPTKDGSVGLPPHVT
jgi:hypothetical protein